MKKMISRARQVDFRNNLHFEFFTVIANVLVKLGKEITHIAELVKKLTELLIREDSALDMIRKYENTEGINNNNEQRNNAFLAMRDIVNRSLKVSNPAKVAAARRLQELFDRNKNVTSMVLPEESAALHNMTQQLRRLEDDVKLLGLEEWLDEMDSANSNVRDLTDERNSEAATRERNLMKEIRREMDAVWADIVSHIEAACTIEGTGKYTELCNEINARVDSYRIIYNREKNAKKKSDTDSNEPLPEE